MIKGQKAPWTTQYLNKTYETFGGFEPGSGSWGSPRVSGNYDILGWGTLLYHLNESDVAAIRDSLTTSSVIPRSSTPVSPVKVQVTTTSISGISDFSSGSATTTSASTQGTGITVPIPADPNSLPVSGPTVPASTAGPVSGQDHVHHHHHHHHGGHHGKNVELQGVNFCPPV